MLLWWTFYYLYYYSFQGRLMISGGFRASWVEVAAAAASGRWAGHTITIQTGSDFTSAHLCVCIWCLSWHFVLQVAALSSQSAAGSESQGPHPPTESIRPGRGGTSEDSELEKFRFWLFCKTVSREELIDSPFFNLQAEQKLCLSHL